MVDQHVKEGKDKVDIQLLYSIEPFIAWAGGGVGMMYTSSYNTKHLIKENNIWGLIYHDNEFVTLRSHLFVSSCFI